MDAAPPTPNSSGEPSSAGGMVAADAPFLGTPYIIDMQRPYEYPFPSPATESCPSLLLPYSHGHSSIAGGHVQHPNAPYQQPLQLTHPYPPSYTSTSSSGSTSTASSVTSSTPPSASSTLVHRMHNVDIHAVPNGGYSSYSHHNHNHHGGSATPYPSTSGVHPPISFRPTTLLRRRSSSHETHHNNLTGLSPASVSASPVPIPPRLLGRDLGVGNANGRWRKGRRSGSDGGGSSSVK